MLHNLSRLTFRRTLAAALVANFAGRFLESNGLYYSICSALFMGAVFEVARWSVMFRDDRTDLYLAGLTISVAWIGFAFGLLALGILVFPSLGSPYARWWSYRSSHIVGLYLWNATLAGYFAFGVLRAFQFSVVWAAKTLVEQLSSGHHLARGGSLSTAGDIAPTVAVKNYGNLAMPAAITGRLHLELFRVALAALCTLLLYFLAPYLGSKYPNELQNHVGIFATFYGAVAIIGGLLQRNKDKTDAD